MKTDDKNTRRLILEAVFEDMQRNGFQGLRADKVVAGLGITKGALYYYFPDKMAIGYAVVEEILRPLFLAYWEPLRTGKENPLDYIRKSIRAVQEQFSGQQLVIGSPLSNLIQEMSPIDEGFRRRLELIVRDIHAILSGSLADAQQKGLIRQGVDTAKLSWFILASFEGAYSISKVSQNGAIFAAPLDILQDYLETIRG